MDFYSSPNASASRKRKFSYEFGSSDPTSGGPSSSSPGSSGPSSSNPGSSDPSATGSPCPITCVPRYKKLPRDAIEVYEILESFGENSHFASHLPLTFGAFRLFCVDLKEPGKFCAVGMDGFGKFATQGKDSGTLINSAIFDFRASSPAPSDIHGAKYMNIYANGTPVVLVDENLKCESGSEYRWMVELHSALESYYIGTHDPKRCWAPFLDRNGMSQFGLSSGIIKGNDVLHIRPTLFIHQRRKYTIHFSDESRNLKALGLDHQGKVVVLPGDASPLQFSPFQFIPISEDRHGIKMLILVNGAPIVPVMVNHKVKMRRVPGCKPFPWNVFLKGKNIISIFMSRSGCWTPKVAETAADGTIPLYLIKLDSILRAPLWFYQQFVLDVQPEVQAPIGYFTS